MKPEEEVTEEGTITFIGDTDLKAYDIRYTYAPTGNENSQEFTLTAEHFTRNENGTYGATGDEAFATAAYDAQNQRLLCSRHIQMDSSGSGWYEIQQNEECGLDGRAERHSC